MIDLDTPWLPARLPGDYQFAKTRAVDGAFVVLARSPTHLSQLFVRHFGDKQIHAVLRESDEEVQDFEYLPTAGGTYVLSATRVRDNKYPLGHAWVRARLSKLDIAARRLDVVLAEDEWMKPGAVFPIELLGCSPDGTRVALACGEAHGSEEMGTMTYRLCFWSQTTQTLTHDEPLIGLFF